MRFGISPQGEIGAGMMNFPCRDWLKKGDEVDRLLRRDGSMIGRKIFLAFLCCLLFSRGAGAASTADDIIKKVEDNLNGETVFMQFTMVVQTKRSKRTMKMDSWARGTEKSFIKITYPAKDRGITFLKLDRAMWQYVPRIEKTIKIPASMMLQSWMGSDFTNDDLVKESSISEDYNPSLVGEDGADYFLDLHARQDAPEKIFSTHHSKLL